MNMSEIRRQPMSEEQKRSAIDEAKSSLLSIHEVICVAIGTGVQIDLSALGSEIERIYGILEVKHD